ncbi:hypothetical protein CSB11_00440 [Candidatus Campbellbacteria bacterium]|nr:MAG: hypothetical protein CSB11_00440 [Candidatus Campbellbacteria bacterium]
MILGFLGKGGSGKSSVSTQMTYFLTQVKNKKVLAIDSDHNMDLSFNLSNGESVKMNSLGESFKDLEKYTGESQYKETFLKNKDVIFTLSPKDEFTEKYTKKISENLNLMQAGPQTENVLYGKSCSHILTTPLKTYLPLLKLKKDEFVVVDEKAGADGVTTGIVTGLDVGVIVFEPTTHSIKTAKQISELMNFYKTPFVFVANKTQSEDDIDFVKQNFENENIFYLPSTRKVKQNPFDFDTKWEGELEKVLEKAKEKNQNNRKERTLEKFKKSDRFEKNSF